VPNNLPNDLSSFVGRDHERAEGVRLLRQTRLLTLSGPGGAGKTRLALRLATDAGEEFPDGVWLAELAVLSDPGLVAQAVAQAAGVHDTAGRPLVDTLADVFSTGRVLLVLDNCEHVVAACAHLAEALLRACHRLRVLATSREPLGVTGEVTWIVPPLALPSGDNALEADAVRLFAERASAVRPSFVVSEANAEAVAKICHRLDGMPLALELAAARVRSMTPSDIAGRLDDRFRLLVGGSRTAPARQQTLRGALDWSYDLLAADERLLFHALAVFNGGFDLDGLRAVGGAELEDVLARLVDRSLVVADADAASGRTRYRLLETVRAYAWQRLVDSGHADQLRQQHAEWLLRQARLADRAWQGPDQGQWLRWAEREHDNVRAALAWLVERGDARSALELVACLWWSWSLHLRWGEALAVFERVLALPVDDPASAFRAGVLIGAGTINIMLGNLSVGRAYLDDASAIGAALGEERLQIQARGVRLIALQFQGAAMVVEQGEELLEWTRRIGWAWAEVRGLETLAGVAAGTGQHARAAELLEQGARISRREGDNWNLARCLEVLGDIERSRGDHARAARLYAESQAAVDSIGLGPYPAAIHNLGYVALAQGDRHRAGDSFAQALAMFRRIGDRRGAAECVIGLGCVLSSGGDGEGAARLFAAGHAALAAMQSQLWPSNRPDYEGWLAVARSRVPAAAFDRAWSMGEEWSFDEAIAAAVEAARVSERSPRGAGLLTSRERQVAQLVARGFTNRQVAEALVVTEKTAANHFQRVLDKLDLHSRSQLAARAAEFGLV
jgi:predicted ATPase/DNA-binding CsgD family transcriptional regulator